MLYESKYFLLKCVFRQNLFLIKVWLKAIDKNMCILIFLKIVSVQYRLLINTHGILKSLRDFLEM